MKEVDVILSIVQVRSLTTASSGSIANGTHLYALSSKVFFTKNCPLSGKDAPTVDYKNINLLRRYMTEKGKILPSRVTQVSTKKQKELSVAIKRARFLALLPYVSRQ